MEVTIIARGPIGSGKSALLGEIEIALRAIGVPVRYANERAAQVEKNLTHADWQGELETYKPSVLLVEEIAPDWDKIGEDIAARYQRALRKLGYRLGDQS